MKGAFNRQSAIGNRQFGFTLIEVMATLVLMGIVLPVAMRGLSVALLASENAKHTSQAASLGEQKLNELVATGDWTMTSASGDFGQDWPGYQWTCQTSARDFNVTEVVVSVVWQQRGQQHNLNVSTMVLETSTNTGSSTLGLTQ